MSKFSVGDRVIAVSSVANFDILIGKIGTVIGVFDGSYNPLAVEFDEKFTGGHDAAGRGKPGHCRYGKYSQFELYEENSLEINIEDLF